MALQEHSWHSQLHSKHFWYVKVTFYLPHNDSTKAPQFLIKTYITFKHLLIFKKWTSKRRFPLVHPSNLTQGMINEIWLKPMLCNMTLHIAHFLAVKTCMGPNFLPQIVMIMDILALIGNFKLLIHSVLCLMCIRVNGIDINFTISSKKVELFWSKVKLRSSFTVLSLIVFFCQQKFVPCFEF